MTQGPQEQRLLRSLTALEATIEKGSGEWETCAKALDFVEHQLRTYSPTVRSEIGGQTGPKMHDAFVAAADGMKAKAVHLRLGRDALDNASTVVTDARTNYDNLGERKHLPPTGARPTANPGEPASTETLNAQKDYDKQVADAAAEFEHREKVSRFWAGRIDTVYAESTETMRQIHGERDPWTQTGDVAATATATATTTDTAPPHRLRLRRLLRHLHPRHLRRRLRRLRLHRRHRRHLRLHHLRQPRHRHRPRHHLRGGLRWTRCPRWTRRGRHGPTPVPVPQPGDPGSGPSLGAVAAGIGGFGMAGLASAGVNGVRGLLASLGCRRPSDRRHRTDRCGRVRSVVGPAPGPVRSPAGAPAPAARGPDRRPDRRHGRCR